MNEVRDASTARRGLLAIALLLAAAALLGLGIADFWPWISDDSFIALRYSRRLLAGEGLTWDAGPPVEGYSNLLWILLCAALRLTGLGWVATARVLGIAATLATFVVLLRARVLAAPAGAPSSLAARACILPLAALAPVALWAIGGLEGPLAMLLVAYVFVRVGEVLRDPTGGSGLPACRAAGIALFFLALCRSEGPLWGGFAGLGILLFARSGPAGESGVLRNRLLWRRLLWLGVPMTIAVLGHLAFRLAYYGEWVPNTAHAKLGTSPQTLAIGLLYVGSAAHVLKSLWIPAAIGALLALFDRRTRGLALITAAAVATWTTYVGLIGGDWYPLCRYLQASYGLLALLVGLGLRQLARWQIGGRPIGSGLAWASAIAAVVVARLDARLDPEDPYQVVSHWEWRGRAVGEWFGRAFGEARPLLALDPAGTVPFYSGLPCLDMLGLCDGTIAKTPPPRPDHVIPAHSRGNPKYVLDREPDLLLFGTPTGELWPRWPGGWQMEAEEPRFLTDYRCIVAHTGPVPVVGEGETDLAITFRVRVDGRVGVARAGDRITVPGWLLTGHRQPVAVHRHEVHLLPKDPARLGPIVEAALAMQHWWENEAAVAVLDRAAGQLVGEVRKPGPLALEDIALPAGSYRLTTEPPVATTGIAFELRGRNGTICERDGELFRLPAEGRVDVVGAVGAAVALPLQLRTLRLERTDAR